MVRKLSLRHLNLNVTHVSLEKLAYNLWRMEVARRFEEAWSAEKALLSVPKMEKAKCRAITEASEKAQMMVELEGSKHK